VATEKVADDADRGPSVDQPRIVGTAEMRVEAEDTATSLRSGSVPVLGTPRLLALCEEATCGAAEEVLQPGETTVGVNVTLTHIAPTPIGATVRARAALDRREGRRLIFTVSVTDDSGSIGAGEITRVVVDWAQFVELSRHGRADG
jgi:fluoroacetyl-CoA thioesterase